VIGGNCPRHFPRKGQRQSALGWENHQVREVIDSLTVSDFFCWEAVKNDYSLVHGFHIPMDLERKKQY
jgi:hypothetical protein